MDLIKKLSVLVFLVCVLIALRNQRALLDSPSLLEEDPSAARRNLGGAVSPLHSDGGEEEERLTYDFYRTSCPSAEEIVRTTVRELHGMNSSLGPALLRLAFHDCFIMGCDASVLLDSAGEMKSEKLEIPNMSLRGFEEIDAIKARLEQECPAVVSCADIVALAARESVLMAGGQFYPVFTGRLDSRMAYAENASRQLPGPDFKLEKALEFFAAKGFNARETIALLGGGHSTGKIHCNFIHDRIFNFGEMKKGADPTINREFLEILKSILLQHLLHHQLKRHRSKIEHSLWTMKGLGMVLEMSTFAVFSRARDCSLSTSSLCRVMIPRPWSRPMLLTFCNFEGILG